MNAFRAVIRKLILQRKNKDFLASIRPQSQYVDDVFQGTRYALNIRGEGIQEENFSFPLAKYGDKAEIIAKGAFYRLEIDFQENKNVIIELLETKPSGIRLIERNRSYLPIFQTQKV